MSGDSNSERYDDKQHVPDMASNSTGSGTVCGHCGDPLLRIGDGWISAKEFGSFVCFRNDMERIHEPAPAEQPRPDCTCNRTGLRETEHYGVCPVLAWVDKRLAMTPVAASPADQPQCTKGDPDFGHALCPKHGEKCPPVAASTAEGPLKRAGETWEKAAIRWKSAAQSVPAEGPRQGVTLHTLTSEGENHGNRRIQVTTGISSQTANQHSGTAADGRNEMPQVSAQGSNEESSDIGRLADSESVRLLQVREVERVAQLSAKVEELLLEMPQEYGQDHPWKAFDKWHKQHHEGRYIWPCSQPLRCLWRYTRKTGAILDQNGNASRPAKVDEIVDRLCNTGLVNDRRMFCSRNRESIAAILRPYFPADAPGSESEVMLTETRCNNTGLSATSASSITSGLAGELCGVCAHPNHSGTCREKLTTDGSPCPCVMAENSSPNPEAIIQRYRTTEENDEALIREAYSLAAAKVRELRAKLEQWKQWGIVEVAVRNPQVADYCKHWEKRAENAEAQLKTVRDALREIASSVLMRERN